MPLVPASFTSLVPASVTSLGHAAAIIVWLESYELPDKNQDHHFIGR